MSFCYLYYIVIVLKNICIKWRICSSILGVIPMLYTPFALFLYSFYAKKDCPIKQKSLMGQSRSFPVCYACMRCQVRMASMSCIRLRTPSFVKI